MVYCFLAKIILFTVIFFISVLIGLFFVMSVLEFRIWEDNFSKQIMLWNVGLGMKC